MIEKNTSLAVRPLVIGHIQRGGTPTADDRVLAMQFGCKAVELIKNNNCGFAVGVLNNKIIEIPLEQAFNETRKFDIEMFKMAMELSF